MALLEPLARPLLSAMFVIGGLDAVRHPESKVEAAQRVTAPLEAKGPFPDHTTPYIRLNGAAQIAAGTLLAVGMRPRLCAIVLLGSLVPTTLAGHRFWELEGDERAAQQIHFLKNLAMAGGLLHVAATSRQ